MNQKLNRNEKFCDSCGEVINAKAEICPKCGVRQRHEANKTVLLLLTFFLGGIGGHKFYIGHGHGQQPQMPRNCRRLE